MRQDARNKQVNRRVRHSQVFLAIVLVAMGVLLVFTSFAVPPTGVIDASVLAAFGEILTFSGSLIGIDYHYQHKEEWRGKCREPQELTKIEQD